MDDADQVRIDDQSLSPKCQPTLDKTKDSNMVAQDKAGGNSLEVPEMEYIHAKGTLGRHEAARPRKQPIGQHTTSRSATAKKRTPVVTLCSVHG